MIYRVSNVASFAYWRSNESACTEKLLLDIAGKGEETEAMRKGTAFHKAIELACAGLSSDEVEANGYTFKFVGDFEIEEPKIKEWRSSKDYHVDGEIITISGQLDAYFGKRIEDYKTTENFMPERYTDGFQWRLYLDIFGCDIFRWNVFECKEMAPFFYEVRALHVLEQTRYPNLENDCQRVVEDFYRFLKQTGNIKKVA